MILSLILLNFYRFSQYYIMQYLLPSKSLCEILANLPLLYHEFIVMTQKKF